MARPSRLTWSGTFGSRRGRVLGAVVSLVALVAVTACGSGLGCAVATARRPECVPRHRRHS